MRGVIYSAKIINPKQITTWSDDSPLKTIGVIYSAKIMGQRRNSVAELSEDDRQTVHEEWQI